MTLIAYQPFKAFYLLIAISFELCRLPLFLFKYLLSYGRQHPQWSFRQALGVRFLSSGLYHVSKVQHQPPLSLAAGAEKECFVVLKPAQDDLYKGPLQNATVKPVNIGATWYPEPLNSKINIKVILQIHGGAFIMGDGRAAASGYMAEAFLRHAGVTHVLCPQYRLSKLPANDTSNPFPAGLQDCLTSYLYLINDLKISANDIILSGDSAGANLAIALLRYITEFGSDLGIPNPSACLLWSPWLDPSDTSGSYVHDNAHYKTDYICPPFSGWGSEAYAGLSSLHTLDQPYINHKNRPFKTVPLWVNVGGAEVLYFDAVKWCEQMKLYGNDVVLDIEDIVPHDVLAIGKLTGFDREAGNCAKRAGDWLKSARK